MRLLLIEISGGAHSLEGCLREGELLAARLVQVAVIGRRLGNG